MGQAGVVRMLTAKGIPASALCWARLARGSGVSVEPGLTGARGPVLGLTSVNSEFKWGWGSRGLRQLGPLSPSQVLRSLRKWEQSCEDRVGRGV